MPSYLSYLKSVLDFNPNHDDEGRFATGGNRYKNMNVVQLNKELRHYQRRSGKMLKYAEKYKKIGRSDSEQMSWIMKKKEYENEIIQILKELKNRG